MKHCHGLASRRRVLTIVSLLLLLLAVPALALAPATGRSVSGGPIDGLFISPKLSLDPPQGLLVDAWYKLEMLEQPVGYMRTAVRREGDRIETLDYTLIEVARGSVTVKIVLKNVTVETLDGKPLEMHTEQVFASQPMHYDAKFLPDGSIDLVITQNGNPVTRKLPADPTATFPWQMTRDILAGRRKPGESFTERSYALVAGTKPMEIQHQAAGQVPLRLPDGRQIQTWRYKVANPGSGTGDVYCEPKLLMPLRFEMPVMGMRFTAMIAPKEQALKQVDKPTELFVSSLLKAKVVRALDPTRAATVLYTIQLPDGDPVDMPVTDMQKLAGQKGRNLQLLVARRGSVASRPASAPSDDVDKYLETTAYCNIDDKTVKDLAAEGAKSAAGTKDPQRLAEGLCRFVYKKIQHKDLDVAFATASEVARTLQGDCTEHAVLLAALARANGLPARGVFGMVAMPGSYADSKLTFGYHMWTQIHVNGRWLDFDAALNQPQPDATHIALGISDLADSSVSMESVQTFMRLAGRVELTADPRR